ncbi:hypothetical protein BGZ68_002576 [Mortierella alpina]|nr:hypothetical protein BGZ68_002576 [Mortierella alpina]
MIMLLNAMFSVACMYSDDPTVRQGAVKYFGHAKLIHDETLHVPTICAIQALLLMAHHQSGHGGYFAASAYTGIAHLMAVHLGLHRQEKESDDSEQGVIKRRLWWALYIHGRFRSKSSGRPLHIRDNDYSVKEPSDHRIPVVIGEAAGPRLETERVISRRLLWTVKLMKILGSILGQMHSIDAETNPQCLAALNQTHVLELHKSLTSWFLELPKELAYEPFTSPPPTSDQPSTHPAALMRMMFYTSLITLHLPYLRGVDIIPNHSTAISTSSSICIAAADNIGHILESLMLQGQLKDSSIFTVVCVCASTMSFLHYADIKTAVARKVATAGLCRSVKFSLELMKTFPSAEVRASIAVDAIASLSAPQQTSAAEPAEDQKNTNPLAMLNQPNAAHLRDIYDASMRAKSSMDGFGPARPVQLRHPTLNISAPLVDDGGCLDTTEVVATWQAQVERAIAIASSACDAPDSRQEHQPTDDTYGLPETLQLQPIEFMSVCSAVPQVSSTADMDTSAYR